MYRKKRQLHILDLTRVRRWVAMLAGAGLLAAAAERAARVWGGNAAWSDMERRGDLCFQSGDLGAAEGWWRNVMNACPDRASACNKLAIVCVQQGRTEEARGLLEDGLVRSPGTVSFLFNLGLLHRMQGRLPEALDCLDAVGRLNPQHGYVHYLRGRIHEEMGQPSRAQREYVRALNVDPASPAVWARVAGGGRAAPMVMFGEGGSGR